MTVSTTISRISYVEDGATTVFPVPFRFLAAADLVVERLLADGSILKLTLGTDYSVAGVDAPAGGSVTRTAAPSGATLRIRRATPETQQMDYTTGDKFPAESHERALDRLTLIAQERDAADAELGARALLASPTDTGLVLPKKASLIGTVKMLITSALDGGLALVDTSAIKGDPGGNVMAIGLFQIASTLSIPLGADMVQTSGHTARGVGSARYVYDAAVNAAYVVANPLTAFLSLNGRGYRLAEPVLDVAMFGAIGDYDFNALTGTDNTAAIQAAINFMTALGDNSPSVLRFTAGYYKVTGSINFPTSWASNMIDGQGAIIVYRGASSATTAIFNFNKTQYIKNRIQNLQLRCEALCGYGILVANPTADMVFSRNVLDTIEVWQPLVQTVQIGNYSVSGHDVDGANNSFRDYHHQLDTGQGGVKLDAPNIFNIEFTNPFFGGYGTGQPNAHLWVKTAAGVYLSAVFTGDNADGVPAILCEQANVSIYGWNTEGTFLFQAKGLPSTQRNFLIENLFCNDSTVSTTPTLAIDIQAGELVLTSAFLGKDNVHPRYINCADTLTATNVFLGQSVTSGLYGYYSLLHPERCIIEGKRPHEVDTIGANPFFHLWWGTAAGDLPVGYAASALGTATISQSTSNITANSPYTCKVSIAAGAALSGQLVDGLVRRTPILPNSLSGSSGHVAVVRGYTPGLTATTTITVRMTYFDRFANPLNGLSVTVTPDGSGNFVAYVPVHPADTTVREIVVNVGLGVAGASGDLYIQSCHVLALDGWSVNSVPNWPCFVDAWTKYPGKLDPIAEYAKAGVVAKWYSAGAYFVREWLAAAAPTSGTYVRGDKITRIAPSAGGPPGDVCVVGGTPGTWKAMANLAA